MVLGTLLIGSGATVLVVSAIPAIAGFGITGITSGSLAAALQASIGNVAAGGLFAKLTSLGAQGYFVSGSISGAVSTIGGILVL
jgi:hypothetical protein